MLLSIVIPTRNRARRVSDLLDSLAAQETTAFDWEVVVVDNASTDDTAEVAQQKSKALPIAIRHIVEPKLGLHHGRHRGVREALGKYVGYLDDDMVLDPTWVKGVEFVAQGKADAVVGRILPKWEAEPPNWLLAMVKGGKFGYLGLLDLGPGEKPVDPSLVFGGNCFFPKRLIVELGGFHPDAVPTEQLRYRGDGETALMKKFKQAGFKAYYDPRATAYHIIGPERLSIEYLCKRAYNQGISDSFAQIRVAYGLTKATSLNSTAKGRYERFRHMSPSDIVRAIGRRAKRISGRLKREPCAKIRNKIAKAYRAGWKFHQKEVRNDPALLQYVLKETYME